MVSSWGSEGGGRGALRWGRGGRRLKQRSAPPPSPGAQALECYSCVQRADDGCSPQKTKTVKCAPGVEVCTEAVGAVETSEWGAPGPTCLLLQAPPARPRPLVVQPRPLSLATPLQAAPSLPPFLPGPGPSPPPRRLGLEAGGLRVEKRVGELGRTGIWDPVPFWSTPFPFLRHHDLPAFCCPCQNVLLPNPASPIPWGPGEGGFCRGLRGALGGGSDAQTRIPALSEATAPRRPAPL